MTLRSQSFDKSLDIEQLVRSERDPPHALTVAIDQVERRRALRRASRLRDVADDDEPVAVFHQQMAHKAQPALLAIALAIEPGIGIGRALVGLVRTLLLGESCARRCGRRPATSASKSRSRFFVNISLLLFVPRRATGSKISGDSERRRSSIRIAILPQYSR